MTMMYLIEDFKSIEGKTIESMYYGSDKDGHPVWTYIEIRFTDGTLLAIGSNDGDEVSAYVGEGE